MLKNGFLSFVMLFYIILPAYAQDGDMHHGMAGMTPETEMSGMYGQYIMNREASGTSWQPDSTPLPGINFMHDDWMLMFDGYLNAIYDHQGGERGEDKTFSSSMAMFMAQHPLAKGAFGLRSMISFDPLMGKNGYPLLLQTGETADGMTPLIDRQHPHDLFMELACTYSVPLPGESSVFAYFGLPGEPALGPPAFMHRYSAMDNPEAPITHHWLDSTHITYGVGTLGVTLNNFKLEGSIFKGREPDQHRWDMESPEFDSGSARLSFNPGENWAMQVSFGYLHSSEQLEPDVDTRRTIASLAYNKPLKNKNWQTTFAWGRNDNLPGKTLDGFLLESAMHIDEKHIFFGRIERVSKDELFVEGDPLHGEKFNVNKVSLGYIYELTPVKHTRWGIGSSLGVNIIPDRLKESYGNTPLSCMIFVRLRLD